MPLVMIAGHEGQQMAFDDETLQQQLDFRASSSVSDRKYGRKCDKKCCNVGRNQGKGSSWFRQKIHFVDVSKLRQPKLCMKTHLVGDDCKPLLIKAGEDVTVPLVTLEQQKKRRGGKTKGEISQRKYRKFMWKMWTFVRRTCKDILLATTWMI